MDELLSFGSVGGLAALLVGSIGAWAWRRKAQRKKMDMGEARRADPTIGDTDGSVTAERMGLAEAESGAGGAGCRKAKGGGVKDAPPHGPEAARTSAADQMAPVDLGEVWTPRPQVPSAEEEPSREDAGERSAADSSAVPAVETDAPFDERVEVAGPVSDQRTAAAQEEGLKGDYAREGQGLGPLEVLSVEEGPKTGQRQVPEEFGGSLALNAANQVDPKEDRPFNAVEQIPGDQDQLVAPQPTEDGTGPDAAAPLPSKLRGSADNRTDWMAEPRTRPDEVVERAADSECQGQADPNTESAPPERPSAKRGDGATRRLRRSAKHRDRRGRRRGAPAASKPPENQPALLEPALRSPAEAKLRLSLHPIRRTAKLSAVLGRPDGFPQKIVLEIDGSPEIQAYDDQRYDDLDLAWTDELLDGELRITSTEGFHWLRSGRRVHIFSENPSEPDLLSVGAARTGAAHTVICRSADARAVRAAAESTRSPDLESCEGWHGIPDGWSVLSGYVPICSATLPLPAALRPLDPGSEIEIGFEDGLCIRNKVFAEGHPPRISIKPEPTGELVTIGGRPAKRATGGGWKAPGWDTPGHHVVDVVPGPSATYQIVADPWRSGGWDFWNAHPGRFEGRASEPCAGTEICGASIRGPEGQVVLAAETRPILIALGMRSGAVRLRPRSDIQFSVGFVSEAPAFLLRSTGQRRTQGQVIWLGQTPSALARGHADPDWVTAVRWATVRRLPLEDADTGGEDAWRKAKARARRLKKSRR